MAATTFLPWQSPWRNVLYCTLMAYEDVDSLLLILQGFGQKALWTWPVYGLYELRVGLETILVFFKLTVWENFVPFLYEQNLLARQWLTFIKKSRIFSHLYRIYSHTICTVQYICRYVAVGKQHFMFSVHYTFLGTNSYIHIGRSTYTVSDLLFACMFIDQLPFHLWVYLLLWLSSVYL